MKEICKVILRLISVSVMLKGFTYVQGYIQLLLRQGYPSSPDFILNSVNFAVLFLLTILFGVLIWVFSGRISSIMLKEEESSITLSTDILLRTAIIIVGVILMANTLPGFVGNVYEYISAQSLINKGLANGYNGILHIKSSIIADLLRMIVAIFMITGYRIIIKTSIYFGEYKRKENLDEGNNNNDV